MAQQVITSEQSPWTGANIYGQILMIIGSLFGGMSSDTASIIAGAITGVIGAVFVIRNWVVNAKFSLNKSWLKDPNNWTSISAILGQLVPAFAVLVEPIRGVVSAIVDKNFAAIITSGLALFSFIYYTYIKK